MLHSFKKFFETELLMANNEQVLLTVSGGIDSMVMLHLFLKSNYKIAVAHCNFALRGNESDGDEKLVEQTCIKYNIPFYTFKFNTAAFANENSISIQMAARQLRYNWFNKIATEHQIDWIATAHHQNDVAETMLINMVRGTGISGLHGILPKNKNIIRPLLFTNKKEIIKYATENTINYREDSSNTKTDYWRNKIRIEVIPKLASLNENVVNNFFELSNRIKIDELLLQEKINELKKNYTQNINGLLYINLKINLHYAAKTLLFHILNEYGFTETEIFQLHNNANITTGAIFESKTHQLLVDRNHFIIREKQVTVINQTIEIGNTTVTFKTPSGLISFETLSEYSKQFVKNCLYLNKEKTGTDFTIRTWQQGDSFKPLGMQGTKLVSDYLIDKKINQFEKEKCLVLIKKNTSEIVAIIPYQINNDFKINEETNSVLKIG